MTMSRWLEMYSVPIDGSIFSTPDEVKAVMVLATMAEHIGTITSSWN